MYRHTQQIHSSRSANTLTRITFVSCGIHSRQSCTNPTFSASTNSSPQARCEFEAREIIGTTVMRVCRIPRYEHCTRVYRERRPHRQVVASIHLAMPLHKRPVPTRPGGIHSEQSCIGWHPFPIQTVRAALQRPFRRHTLYVQSVRLATT